MEPHASLYVRWMAIHETMPPQVLCRQPAWPEWLIVLFHHAVRVGTCAEDALEVPAGTLMIWPPMSGHVLGSGGRHWDHSWILVGGAAVAAAVDAAGLVPLRPYPLTDPNCCDAPFAAILGELQDQRSPDPLLLSWHLSIALRQAARCAGDTAASAPIDPRLVRIRRHLDASPGDCRLERLAALAGMSVTTVCRHFVAAFGKPPGAYAVDVRMAHACRLLADPSRSIANVAAELGWRDPFHFSRFFRARFGLSPTDFRTHKMSETLR